MYDKKLAYTVKKILEDSPHNHLKIKDIAQAMGLRLSFSTAEFLIKRLNRDLGSLFSALVELDQASLEAKRKLTIPFIKSVLGI